MKKVVVVGAGYAGSGVAGKLDKAPGIELTVIDRREAFVHKIGALRASVKENWADKVVVPRDKLLKNGKLVLGDVTSVTDKAVTLADGTSVAFDFCVLATGATNRSPGEPSPNVTSVADLKRFYTDSAKTIAAAKKVVIIGGGPVGVELAGDIKETHPNTEVTIVHNNAKFISGANPAMPAALHPRLAKLMDKMGIKYVLGESVEVDMDLFRESPLLVGTRTVKTSGGKEIAADLVISCVGTKPNTSPLPAAWLNDKGLVKVNQYLQVIGAENVFALGDITDVPEQKVAYLTGAQAPVVAKNLLALASGRAPSKKYKAHKDVIMLIPIGAKLGAFVTPIKVWGSFLTSKIKGKSLFLSLGWGLNHQRTPSAN